MQNAGKGLRGKEKRFGALFVFYIKCGTSTYNQISNGIVRSCSGIAI